MNHTAYAVINDRLEPMCEDPTTHRTHGVLSRMTGGEYAIHWPTENVDWAVHSLAHGDYVRENGTWWADLPDGRFPANPDQSARLESLVQTRRE